MVSGPVAPCQGWRVPSLFRVAYLFSLWAGVPPKILEVVKRAPPGAPRPREAPGSHTAVASAKLQGLHHRVDRPLQLR